MSGRVYWWTCHHPGCLDMMARSCDPERVRTDQAAHIEAHHGDYDYSDIELRLSSWHESDY